MFSDVEPLEEQSNKREIHQHEESSEEYYSNEYNISPAKPYYASDSDFSEITTNLRLLIFRVKIVRLPLRGILRMFIY